MTPLPPGPFGCILADPPWAFKTWSGGHGTPHRTANDHYQTEGFATLAQIPVGAVCERDAALFMWAVDSHLDEAIDLGRAWGFRFKTLAFIWTKTLASPDQFGFFPPEPRHRIGMGYWTRKQAEVCLLFTRGAPKRRSKAVRQIIASPRREHSRKPDEQYERIEALVAGPYLEMFARQTRPGWTAWGNEVGKFGEAA